MSPMNDYLLPDNDIAEMSKTFEGRQELHRYVQDQCTRHMCDVGTVANAMRTLGMHDAADRLCRVYDFLRQPPQIMSAISIAESDEGIRDSRRTLVGLLGLSLRDSDPELAKSIVAKATGNEA